jgi:hypothetical protein
MNKLRHPAEARSVRTYYNRYTCNKLLIGLGVPPTVDLHYQTFKITFFKALIVCPVKFMSILSINLTIKLRLLNMCITSTYC